MSIIHYYHTILMPFLLEYARYITEREISENWNSGSGNREKGRKINLHQMTWNLTENFCGIFKNFWVQNILERGHQLGTSHQDAPPHHALIACGAPTGPLATTFSYIVCFILEKIISYLSGRSAAVSRRKPGQRPFILRREILRGEFPSERGKSKSSSSPTLPPSWDDQYSSTSSPEPSHLQS